LTGFAGAFVFGACGTGVGARFLERCIGTRLVVCFAVAIIIFVVATFGTAFCVAFAGFFPVGITLPCACLALARFVWVCACFADADIVCFAVAIFIDAVVAEFCLWEDFSGAGCGPLSVCAGVVASLARAFSGGVGGSCVAFLCEWFVCVFDIIDFAVAIIVDTVAYFGCCLDVIDLAVAVVVFSVADFGGGEDFVVARCRPCAIGLAGLHTIATVAFEPGVGRSRVATSLFTGFATTRPCFALAVDAFFAVATVCILCAVECGGRTAYPHHKGEEEEPAKGASHGSSPVGI
jgi:hypothetical protein